MSQLAQALLTDIRFGLRALRKAPAFSIIAILGLTLGIGANAAIFSLVDATLIRSLPYKDPDRLVMVWQDATFVGFPRATATPADYVDWKRQNVVFTGMAAMRIASGRLTVDGPPEEVPGQAVTADFFDVLGVRPAIGRLFTETEDRNAAQVVLISDGLWNRRYQRDPAVLGRTMPINGAGFTVIGVLPPSFEFQNRATAYWVPASLTPPLLSDRNAHILNVVARLGPDVTVAQARGDLHAIARRLQDQGVFDRRSDVTAVALRQDLLGNTEPSLLVLLGAAGCVLLIACANLANLMLVRNVGRRAELAVRAALGASRARILRQLATESVLLSITGGGLGLACAFAAIRVLGRLVPPAMPETASPSVDLRLFGFALSVSVLTGLVLGVVPALRATRASLLEALKLGGRSQVGNGNRMRDALVIIEVAAAFVLLVGAGLLLRTLGNLRAIDIGFRADRLLTMRAAVIPSMTPDERMDYYDRVVTGVRALPGVEQAAFVNDLPFQGSGNSQAFQVEGRAPQENGPALLALYRVCTTDYLRALGVTLLAGRLFDASDGAASMPIVVITRMFADQFFHGESALGHRLQVGGPTEPWSTIVGVVADVHERGYESAMMPGVYILIEQNPNAVSPPRTLVVRAKGEPASLADSARRVIAGVNSQQPVSQVRTMEEWIDLDVADRHEEETLLGTFAFLALLLASLGLYGVLSYAATQRKREIAVRIALGASAASIRRMIIRQGLTVTAVGLMIGSAVAWATTRAMTNVLYGVRPTDPVTFASVGALLATIALAACWIPSRKAALVSPTLLLHEG